MFIRFDLPSGLLFLACAALCLNWGSAYRQINSVEDLVSRVREDDSLSVKMHLATLATDELSTIKGKHPFITKEVCEMKMGDQVTTLLHIRSHYSCEMTLMHFAAKHGFAQIIRWCHELGADLDSRSEEQCDTPLLTAARARNRDMIFLFLGLHANANAQDSAGDTVLHNRVRARDYELAQELVTQFKANPDLQNIYGNTALHEAVSNHDFEMAKMLVDTGKASVEIQNFASQTPLNLVNPANLKTSYDRKKFDVQESLRKHLHKEEGEGRFSRLLESPRQMLRAFRHKSQ